ncbi:hypothetical protein D3C87_1770000 [compost metagenome]
MVNMILEITMYTISIAFVFPYITHQTRSKKAAKNIVQHLHLREIGMVSVKKWLRNSDGPLNAFRIINNAVFFFIGWLHRMCYCR